MTATLSIRIDIAGQRLGPGKIALLEAIGREGSITAAGAALGMSYRRTWLLANAINRMFREPAVATQQGGRAGGGASLTPWGRTLIELYRGVETKAQESVASDLARMEAEIRS